MIGKVLLGIFAIFLLLGVFREGIIDGITGIRSDTSTESHVVATAVGVTTANVTLSKDLYQAAITEVSSISSNITETPVAAAYTEATKVLNIAALSANTSRTLAIAYLAETDDTTWRVLGPFMVFLIFGGILGAIVWSIYKGRHR